MRKVVAAVFILSFFASQGDCRVGGVYFCKTTWLNFSVKHCVLFSNNYLVSPSHFFFFFLWGRVLSIFYQGMVYGKQIYRSFHCNVTRGQMENLNLLQTSQNLVKSLFNDYMSYVNYELCKCAHSQRFVS